ncbi:MAG: hypothetical protein OEV94_10330 [Deltaproteobacteria bacterium]|nr:hypothetical protein [Deltaproteobacteria bacterium]
MSEDTPYSSETLLEAEGSLSDKLKAMVTAHQRFVEQFHHSLENALRFVQLAAVSREQEPEETRQMLRQIQALNLPGHIHSLREDFLWMKTFIQGVGEDLDESETLAPEMDDLMGHYEQLEDEAVSLTGEMEDLLAGLNT